MKFYELDLTKLIPYGVPINSDDHVEYKNYINEFFLKGFENYFSRLFTVDDDTLIRDYSRSCAGPTSLEACRYCTDDQLRDYIAEAGFPYYSGNHHDINAAFLHALYAIPLGTPEWLTAITRYVANTSDVEATPIYHDSFTYDVTISGDITGSVNSKAILERITDNLGVLGTAHTKVSGFTLEDTGSNVGAYAAVSLSDVNITFNTRVFGQDNLEAPLALLALDDNASMMLESVGGMSDVYLMSNDGINWTPMEYNTSYLMRKGEARYFKSSGTGTVATPSIYSRFVLTGRFEAYNNIASMSSNETELAVPGLFENCTTLLRAPSLSTAEVIAQNGCYRLFAGCTLLTKAPALPAMQLGTGCYREMFSGCTSLTKAPYLPAGLIPEQGYYQMFYGCSNLSEIRCDAFEISTSNCVTDWVAGVSSTGDFYGNQNAGWLTGDNGIPSGWIFHTNEIIIIIGETTSAPVDATSLSSEYWWVYAFDGSDGGSNLYNPNYFASEVMGMADYVGVDGIEFSDARYWDGLESSSVLSETAFKLAMYNEKPEIYTHNSVLTGDGLTSGILLKPGTLPTWTSLTIWELPSDLYSITNGTITWNEAHTLYNVFRGLRCYKS